MLLTTIMANDLKSLDIAEGLIDLLLENSLNRKRLLRMSVDDLACVLGIDIEAAKIIQSSARNQTSNTMIQEMTELR